MFIQKNPVNLASKPKIIAGSEIVPLLFSDHATLDKSVQEPIGLWQWHQPARAQWSDAHKYGGDQHSILWHFLVLERTLEAAAAGFGGYFGGSV